MSMLEFSRKTRESFGRVESWCAEIPVDQIQPSQHPVVIEKFINAILNNGGELVAHGTEGVNSVIIANAIMLSSFTKRMVDIPFNPDEYKNILEDLKKKSKFVKKCKLM